MTSAGGHFGREPSDGHFTWEQLNPEIIEALQQS
jgi:NAD(P)H-dependent flavin oxidoreductase YrpB (nitropropane dioxygenase family)